MSILYVLKFSALSVQTTFLVSTTCAFHSHLTVLTPEVMCLLLCHHFLPRNLDIWTETVRACCMPPASLCHPIILSLFSPEQMWGVIWFTGTHDIRSTLREHTSTHSDDITSMHFSQSSSSSSECSHHLLLSGSTDRLICILNADKPEEDEAALYVGNVGSSITQVDCMPSHAACRQAYGL